MWINIRKIISIFSVLIIINSGKIVGLINTEDNDFFINELSNLNKKNAYVNITIIQIRALKNIDISSIVAPLGFPLFLYYILILWVFYFIQSVV